MPKGLFQLYDRIPSAGGKSLIASGYAWWSGRTKYGGSYPAWREFLKEAQWWNAERVRAYQLEHLREILELAVTHSSFYRESVAQSGLRVDALSSIEDVKALPVINKSVVRAHHDEIRTGLGQNGHLVFPTSGTTGQSLQVPVTADALQREYAYRWLYKSELGAELGDRFAVFTGQGFIPLSQKRPPFWVRNYAENSIMFSVHHMSKQTVPSYCDAYNAFRPRYVYGFPSALYTLASFARKTGISLAPPRAVFPTSEKLHPWQRSVIEEVFGAPTYNYYAQVELTVNVQECPQRRMHVREEYGLLEILNDEGNEVRPGECGRVVGTGWGNRAIPLLRYDTGDLARLSIEKSCPCGRGGRILEDILGRSHDVIITPDGRHIGHMGRVAFKPLPSIRERQIIQESLRELLVRIVPDGEFTTQDKGVLIGSLREYLGKEVNIRIETVPSLPRDKSGKVRYVISKVSSGDIAIPSTEMDHGHGALGEATEA